MIRVRLRRVSTRDSRIVRVPSAQTPRPAELVVEGSLLCAVPVDQPAPPAVRYADSFAEGIDYGALVALLLDTPNGDGRPQVYLTGEVTLIVSTEEGVPVTIHTASSEYQITVLAAERHSP